VLYLIHERAGHGVEYYIFVPQCNSDITYLMQKTVISVFNAKTLDHSFPGNSIPLLIATAQVCKIGTVLIVIGGSNIRGKSVLSSGLNT